MPACYDVALHSVNDSILALGAASTHDPKGMLTKLRMPCACHLASCLDGHKKLWSHPCPQV